MHIEVDITDPHTSGVEQAQLIIDGEIQDIFTNHIEWIWSGRAAGLHTITIVASDKAGNEATKEIQVIIFNL
ncbi:MAG: hypothetical protein FE047_02855 [Thermoplasmata archaeon]|nr:MAG: hypothetical protein FE047_02855 [Thermoplasmata archaeon]